MGVVMNKLISIDNIIEYRIFRTGGDTGRKTGGSC